MGSISRQEFSPQSFSSPNLAFCRLIPDDAVDKPSRPWLVSSTLNSASFCCTVDLLMREEDIQDNLGFDLDLILRFRWCMCFSVCYSMRMPAGCVGVSVQPTSSCSICGLGICRNGYRHGKTKNLQESETGADGEFLWLRLQTCFLTLSWKKWKSLFYGQTCHDMRCP